MDHKAEAASWAIGARLFGLDAAVSLWIASASLVIAAIFGAYIFESRQSEAELVQSLLSTERTLRYSLAVTQRALLSIETTMAAADSTTAVGTGDAQAFLSPQLADLVSANLLVRDLVLVGRAGNILAAGTNATLSHGLHGQLMLSGHSRSRVWIGDEVEHQATREVALYIYSHAKSKALPAGSVWVAVVPSISLSASLGYSAFDTFSVSLESANGNILLGSLDNSFNGKKLPVIDDKKLDGVARLEPGRVSDAPLLIAASKLVDDSNRVVVSLPVSEATPGWSKTHTGLRVTLSAFVLLVIGGAICIHYTWRARLILQRSALSSMQNVFDSIQLLPYGLVLVDSAGRLELWTHEVESLVPHGNSKLLKGAPVQDWAALCESPSHVIPPLHPGIAIGVGGAYANSGHRLLSPTIQYSDGRVLRIAEHMLPGGRIVVIIRDVTNTTKDLKLLSLKLQRTVDEDHQLMNKMLKDLISPVTAIAGVVDLMSRTNGWGGKDRDLVLLRQQTDRLLLALRSLNVYMLQSEGKQGIDQYREIVESVRF